MKNILIIIILSIFFFNNISANERVIDSLKNEGKLIFIRHAHAPGGGDPNNFNIRDCKTQRNLDLDLVFNKHNCKFSYFKAKFGHSSSIDCNSIVLFKNPIIKSNFYFLTFNGYQ